MTNNETSNANDPTTPAAEVAPTIPLRPARGFITTGDKTAVLPASCSQLTAKGRKQVVSSLAWRLSRTPTGDLKAAFAAAGIDPKAEPEWSLPFTDAAGVEHVIGLQFADAPSAPAPAKSTTKEVAAPKPAKTVAAKKAAPAATATRKTAAIA